MPKYSRSRSRDRRRDHKHKDKKKHRKHSRSSDRRDHRDYRKEDSERDRKYHDRKERNRDRDNGYDQRTNGRDFHQSSSQDKTAEEYKNKPNPETTSTSQSLKRSRFSDQPLAPPHGQQPQAPSSGLMPPPTSVPQKRKKFVWTDADEDELRDSFKIKNLDESQPALMLGTNTNLLQNLNPAILSALQDSSKIKKKIYLPQNTGVNYIGLLIGPKGLYQKRLEEESGCKILIRGKGSQKEGAAPQPDDDDEQHVLVIGDSADSVRRAQNAIERVISADETTRNKIREEQLNVAQQINNQVMPNAQMDDSMMTPYGPPSPYAYIIPVPNDCVGLIIGKGGDTIRQLQMESGAKIQVAKKEIPNSNLRNVFVEGTPEKYQRAKEMIEEIIREHRRATDSQIHVGDVNPFTGPHHKLKVPDKFVGLIIGKNGENLRGIAQRSNTRIFVPQKNTDPGSDERTIEVDGDSQSVEIARQEIYSLIQRYMSQSGSSNYDYSKNPYGSGIAVYNQSKLATDGSTINGAVPDSLKPEGSYASSLLTENPMIAYASMQLTGWSQYEDQNAQKPQEQTEGQEQGYNQEGYDYNYQNYYAGGQQPPYDQSTYQGYDQYYGHYYGQQYPQSTDQTQAQSQTQGQTQAQTQGQEQDQATTQKTEGEAQPSTDAQGGPPQQPPTGDYSQQYQDYYNQYYQYYGTYPPADQQAYYQQYYGANYQAQPDSGAYPQQVQGQNQEEQAKQGDQQPNQQPPTQ